MPIKDEPMRLYSYVVARDYGFAPNPFFGFCTLACCKPQIRKSARAGDWVVGTGPMKKGLGDRLVYAMKVEEIVDFDRYWSDPRFTLKRPHFRGALKHAYGDNIYHREETSGRWIQEDSHHSTEGGQENSDNLVRDTGTTDLVLIAKRFAYWGGKGPEVPVEFRDFGGQSLSIHSSAHKCRFSDDYVSCFVDWFESLKDQGVCSAPDDWGSHHGIRMPA